MQLKSMTINDVRKNAGRNSWAGIVQEFMDSGDEAAEVIGYFGNLSSAYSSLHRYIHVCRADAPVKVIRSKNGLYLTRTDL